MASETLHDGDYVEPPREPAVGDTMPDGTVFAGISPDTGKAMFATPAEVWTLIRPVPQSVFPLTESRNYFIPSPGSKPSGESPMRRDFNQSHSKKLAATLPAQWRMPFRRFVENGEAEKPFLDFLDADKACQAAVETIFNEQAAGMERIGAMLRSSKKRSLPKRNH
jgi:hypothetical protein